MRILAAIAGLALLSIILWDAFETIILPRRVIRQFRLTRAFYRYSWTPWSALIRRMSPGKRRDALLGYFGPLSLLLLFGIWFAGLILSFGLLHWAAGSALNLVGQHPSFTTDLYLSGTTFFTLGLGDVAPRSALARLITVVESGTGFGLLAIVISYLPVLYGAFSARETNISLMDARAGSPPTAAELLRRHAQPEQRASLIEYLRDWESWSAQLMESHLSYPVLCLFRSQHSNQSWLAALATVLDASAFLAAHAEGELQWQAQLTFAIARHAVVDLSQVISSPPLAPAQDRFPAAESEALKASLLAAGMPLTRLLDDERFRELRQMYEPYVNGLAGQFFMPLPPWSASQQLADNWQRSAWNRIPRSVRRLQPSAIIKGEDSE
ncbi:MAG TPA: potassium channel family protein [Terriglobia bacterium]|nr:potassium channel family protein [Terriglobia bacterium]